MGLKTIVLKTVTNIVLRSTMFIEMYFNGIGR